jgi:hypothetical protein
MSAVLNLIEEVRQFGVTLRAEPPDLVITPAGVVPSELRAKLKQHKPDILRRLELEQSMRRLEAAHILLAISEDGDLRIVQTDPDAQKAILDGFTIYTPRDAYMYVNLTQSERRMLHGFKTICRQH